MSNSNYQPEQSSRQLTVFKFNENQIRTVAIEGEAWFVGNDACKVLDISDSKQAIERLDEDERGWCTVPTPGGPQKMAVINQSGLYSLILTSRKPEAKAFKRWITHEVIPSIMKTGAYSLRDLEKLAYKAVKDCFALSSDYDVESPVCRGFLASLQNKIYFAATGKTAAEIIAARANRSRPNMGLQSWQSKRGVGKFDIVVGKNYLTEDELKVFSRLDQAISVQANHLADQVERQNMPITMVEFLHQVDELVLAFRMKVLRGKGAMSREEAEKIAAREYEAFKRLLAAGK